MARGRIRISETEENLDWIKTKDNRESERRIHNQLAGKARKDKSTNA